MGEHKKKILLVGECTGHGTGYGVYGREVMSRLHSSGKYELAELSSYLSPADPVTVPWKCYPVLPGDNPAEQDEYASCGLNQFGAWKFEETLLKVKCDIVFAYRDVWMDEHIERSPFRGFFKWFWMPTCDSVPQADEWLATMANADGLLVYSEWAKDVLEKQSGGRLKVSGVASPAADYEVFKPVEDKGAHRESLGMDRDSLIVGKVARNQVRKLFPDLFDAFALFLREAPEDISRKTYLYCHTGFPDAGWDIPRLIRDAGIASKVLFTYTCRDCGAWWPSYYADARTVCKRCGSNRAGLPTTGQGVSREALADIINLCDVMVQYANSEGYGLPVVEAAACGVPVMAVDYSAMADVVRNVGGVPIKVERFYREPATHCLKALPDNKDFSRKLTELLILPRGVRQAMGRRTRQKAMARYSYDQAAAEWMGLFDQTECPHHSKTWASPPKKVFSAPWPPPELPPMGLARWLISQVVGRPDLVNSAMALRMARDLTWGASPAQMGGYHWNEAPLHGSSSVQFKDFSPKEAYQEMLKLAERHNLWEERRVRGLVKK